jgi:hypothetical protein
MAPQPRSIKPKDIVLNLDTLEREESEVKPEFAIVINGQRLVFEDAANLEWDVLEVMDTPSDFVEYTLSEEDQKVLRDAKLPGWKFRALWEAYQAHYGLGSRGNARG